MKKMLTLALALALTVTALVGCAGKKGSASDKTRSITPYLPR